MPSELDLGQVVGTNIIHITADQINNDTGLPNFNGIDGVIYVFESSTIINTYEPIDLTPALKSTDYVAHWHVASYTYSTGNIRFEKDPNAQNTYWPDVGAPTSELGLVDGDTVKVTGVLGSTDSNYPRVGISFNNFRPYPELIIGWLFSKYNEYSVGYHLFGDNTQFTLGWDTKRLSMAISASDYDMEIPDGSYIEGTISIAKLVEKEVYTIAYFMYISDKWHKILLDLPTASTTQLGGVKIGNGLVIDSNGTLSLDPVILQALNNS